MEPILFINSIWFLIAHALLIYTLRWRERNIFIAILFHDLVYFFLVFYVLFWSIVLKLLLIKILCWWLLWLGVISSILALTIVFYCKWVQERNLESENSINLLLRLVWFSDLFRLKWFLLCWVALYLFWSYCNL